MADEPKVVFTSFDPADAVRGGLITDVDVLIKDLLWTMDAPPDYHSREPSYFLKGYLTLIEDPNVVEEVWWSAGTCKAHTPCGELGEPQNEGYRLTGGPMIQGSNALLFIKSLQSCGIDAAPGSHRIASGDLRQLIGIEMHVIRKVIEREGLQRAPREDGRTQAGVVLCQKIIRIPGERRAAKTKPATAASAAAAAAKPAAASAAAATAAIAAAATPAAASTAVPSAAALSPAARSAAAHTAAALSAAAPSTAAAPVAKAGDTESMASVVLADMMLGKPGGLTASDARIQANRILFSIHKLGLTDRERVIAVMLDPAWLETQGVLLEGETLVLAA